MSAMTEFTCRHCDGTWTAEKRRGQTPFYCEPCRPEVKRKQSVRNAKLERERDPERVRARNKAWREANPDRLYRHHLKTLYRMTPERYDAMLAAQNAACAVCENSDPGGHGRWHIDHDHGCCPGGRSCGECVRGLLCRACNAMLVAGYERLPSHLKTWDVLNKYLGLIERDPLLVGSD